MTASTKKYLLSVLLAVAFVLTAGYGFWVYSNSKTGTKPKADSTQNPPVKEPSRTPPTKPVQYAGPQGPFKPFDPSSEIIVPKRRKPTSIYAESDTKAFKNFIKDFKGPETLNFVNSPDPLLPFAMRIFYHVLSYSKEVALDKLISQTSTNRDFDVTKCLEILPNTLTVSKLNLSGFMLLAFNLLQLMVVPIGIMDRFDAHMMPFEVIQSEFTLLTAPMVVFGIAHVPGPVDKPESFSQVFPHCKPIVIVAESKDPTTNKLDHAVYLKMKDSTWTRYDELSKTPQTGLKDEEVLKLETDYAVYHNEDYELYKE